MVEAIKVIQGNGLFLTTRRFPSEYCIHYKKCKGIKVTDLDNDLTWTSNMV